MILVCGVHGSGKTRYKNNLALKYGIHVDYIWNTSLCIWNEKKGIERIGLEVFEKLEISEIHLVTCSLEDIISRRMEKNETVWEPSIIHGLLNEEKRYAMELAERFHLELKIVDTSSDNKKNIILPIAPEYCDKILSGEKKYEYRKKLCNNKIDKIYLYSTAPVKGLVGEVEVIGKLEESKENVWNTTYLHAGIEKVFFEQYFAKYSKACAYELGRVKKYKEKIPLKNVGISYVIQSFTYVNDL